MKTTLFKVVGSVLVLGLILFISACSPKLNIQDDTKPLSEATIAEIEAEVNTWVNKVVGYAEAGDLESLLSTIDQSVEGSYIDGSYRYASSKECQDLYRANWKVASQDFGGLKTKVCVLAPNVALASLTAKVSATNEKGTKFPPTPFAITYILVRKEGKWLVHSFQQHSDPRQPLK